MANDQEPIIRTQMKLAKEIQDNWLLLLLAALFVFRRKNSLTPNTDFGPDFTNEVNPPNAEPANFLNQKDKPWLVRWNFENGKLPIFFEFPKYGLNGLSAANTTYQLSTKCDSFQIKKGDAMGYVVQYNTSQFGKLKGWVKVRMNILKPCQINPHSGGWELFYPYNFAKGAKNMIEISVD